jgi:hypothetical protein
VKSKSHALDFPDSAEGAGVMTDSGTVLAARLTATENFNNENQLLYLIRLRCEISKVGCHPG